MYIYLIFRFKFEIKAKNNLETIKNETYFENNDEFNPNDEEEEPAWRDINVNDMDTMKFQALPKLGSDGMNTSEDILGHLEDLSNSNVDKLSKKESEKLEELKQLLKDSSASSKQEREQREKTDTSKLY